MQSRCHQVCFFEMPEIMFELIKTLMIAMFTACFMLYLMYHFSASLAEFAADMTEGVSLSNIAIKPQDVFKTAQSAFSEAGGGMSSDKMAAGGGMSSDKMASGGGKSSDKMSTKSRGALDKFSTGGDDEK